MLRFRKEHEVKIYVVSGVILAALGAFGALFISSIFFGFFTSGIFLAAYDLLTEKEEKKGERQITEATSTAPAPQPPSARSFPNFCPNCGSKQEENVRSCPLCGKQLGEDK
jgi:membrane protease subunit (stomatin/prohibitin family)